MHWVRESGEKVSMMVWASYVVTRRTEVGFHVVRVCSRSHISGRRTSRWRTEDAMARNMPSAPRGVAGRSQSHRERYGEKQIPGFGVRVTSANIDRIV